MQAKEMKDFLKKVYTAYTGDTYIPKHEHTNPSTEMIGFRHVGGCALQTVYEKTTEIKENSGGFSDYTQHVMNKGNYMARMFTEPLAQHAQGNLDAAVEFERYMNFGAYHGYADAILQTRQLDGKVHKAIIEIKATESPNGKKGTPHYQYALQLMGYMEAMGPDYHGYLLINSHRGWSVYSLEKRMGSVPGEHWYILMDEFGDEYLPPKYQENWNVEGMISPSVMHKFYAEYKIYKELVENILTRNRSFSDVVIDLTNNVIPPINPEEPGKGWRCAKKLSRKKDAPYVAQCRFTYICHPNHVGNGDEEEESD